MSRQRGTLTSENAVCLNSPGRHGNENQSILKSVPFRTVVLSRQRPHVPTGGREGGEGGSGPVIYWPQLEQREAEKRRPQTLILMN